MTIYKVIRFERTGNGFKERLHVKTFKNANDMGVFLASKHNDFDQWRESDNPAYPDKTGVYAFAGGKYHNVKTLDASILTRI